MRKIFFSTIILFTLTVQANNFADGLRLYDKKDYSGAFKVWEQQAKDGLINAQHNVGVMYDRGLGVPKDKTQAIVWFKKAGMQGHRKSQYTLGSRYFNGKHGAEKDYTKAIYWWKKAATQGSLSAKYNLGVLYLYANEKFANKAKAKKWLQLAVKGGHINAKSELNKLELQLAMLDQEKLQVRSASTDIVEKPTTSKIKEPLAEVKSNKIPKSKDQIPNKQNTDGSEVRLTKTKDLPTNIKSLKTKQEVPIIEFFNKPQEKPNTDDAKEPATKISSLDPGFKIVMPGIKDKLAVNKKPDAKSEKKAGRKVETSLKAKNKTSNKKAVTKLKKTKTKTKTKSVSDWVSAQSSSRYTIQLAVAGSLKKAKQFKAKHKLGTKAHVYKIKNKKLYKIIIGSYSNKAKAQRAIRKLSSKLRKLGAWPKKFAVVHKEKKS